MDTKRMATMGLFVALSVLGAQFKIFGSIALDMVPAYLAAMLFSPVFGGCLGAIAHIVTAVTAGFFFGVPLHFVVAVAMFASAYAVGWVYHHGKQGIVRDVVCLLTAWVMNVGVALACCYPWLGEAVWALVGPLTLAALVNSGLAIFLQELLSRRKRGRE